MRDKRFNSMIQAPREVQSDERPQCARWIALCRSNLRGLSRTATKTSSEYSRYALTHVKWEY